MINAIPILQVRDDSYVVYYEPLFARKYANNLFYRNRMLKVQKTQYSGGMTVGTRKRMARAITLLSQATPGRTIYNEITKQYQYHKLSFITLTVSAQKNITSRDAYDNLLKPFLGWLRDTKGVKTYIWKLEFQMRGQPHYHITLPDFIHYEEIRKTWNSLQRKAGYLDEYASEHKHFNPNSTDIHNVKYKRNLAHYMVKELAKSVDAKRVQAIAIVNSLIQAGEIPADQKQKFIDEYTGEELKAMGKVWDCSNNLAGISYFAVPMERWHEDFIKALKLTEQVREVTGDWWSMIYLTGDEPPPGTDILSKNEKLKFLEHVHAILN